MEPIPTLYLKYKFMDLHIPSNMVKKGMDIDNLLHECLKEIRNNGKRRIYFIEEKDGMIIYRFNFRFVSTEKERYLKPFSVAFDIQECNIIRELKREPIPKKKAERNESMFYFEPGINLVTGFKDSLY